MRLTITSLFLICASLFTCGQTSMKLFQIKKQASFDLGASTSDFKPSLLINEMPKQSTQKIVYYNYPQKEETPSSQKPASVLLPVPIKNQSFLANLFSINTPNDNDMAISDSGKIISVINTNIYMRDVVTNSVYPNKSLSVFTTPINNNHQEFDPKVMYDPKTDRFVLVCLVGFVDSTSKVVIGFSKSNNPNGQWNLYVLPGNPLNNNLWTDYPMIAMTEKELFLSVNLLTNNSSWQTGFVETVIWQMKKDSGYAGAPSLGALLHSNIKYNGRAIRNLCPVKGGSQLYKPNMYFISNRNFASQNDSVFLVNVTDTIGSPSNTVTVKLVINSQPYYFPPDGIQPNAANTLATNDSRNLGAFFENNKIQYVHNTKNPVNNRVSVYYGIIDSPQSNSPTATGYILPNDSLDFAYPNISYAGKSSADNNAIITFDHSSNLVFPGCSAIQSDGNGNFSPILKIKDGLTYINLLTSSQERWGDYSGSQRRYNNPGEVWMSGYYGCFYNSSFPKAHAAWVAQIYTDELFTVGLKKQESGQTENASVFPNPAKDIYSVNLLLAKPEYLSFELFDAQGKLVQLLLRDWVKTLDNTFSFSTRDLTPGVYVLKISGNYKTNLVKKVIID